MKNKKMTTRLLKCSVCGVFFDAESEDRHKGLCYGEPHPDYATMTLEDRIAEQQKREARLERR